MNFTNILKEIIILLFAFYMIFLFQITVLRIGFPIKTVGTYINFIPFLKYYKMYSVEKIGTFIYLFVGNIIWFVPFGFLLPYIMKKEPGFFKTTLFGFFVSLSIEILQFVFHTGVSDIDDITLNVVGAMVGYSI